jgi:hypothetical protein
MTSPTDTTQTDRPPKVRRTRQLSKRDADLVEGLLLGLSLKAAAQRAGMSYSTALRRRQDPVWSRKMMEAEAEAVKAVVRRGIRSAEAAMGVLARVAGNVKGEDNVGAAERPEARTQVYAARALLSAFVGIHGRALVDDDAEAAALLAQPQVDWVLHGVDWEALR